VKKALLFALALIAVGCAEGELEESASCAALPFESPLEDVLLCAEQGDARAQYNLGLMYAEGEGVPEDDVEAVRWYRLATEQGDAVAQNNLGVMYATGAGVPEDDAESVRWYRLAAEPPSGLTRQDQQEVVADDTVGKPD
jgi:TPR repeat protein